MSSTTFTPSQPPLSTTIPRQGVLFTRWSWICIAVLAALFIWLHWPFIERMVRIATNTRGAGFSSLIKGFFAFAWNHDWSHMLAIPFIALFYVVQQKRALWENPTRVYWPGLALMIAGIFSFMFWVYPGRNDLFQGLSMMTALFGLLLFLLGPTAMKVLWFPVAYLVFAIRMPQAIWDAVANRLQDVAATVATVALKVVGALLNFETEKIGNLISISYMREGQIVTSNLTVAEACAGLRMLMAFVALGVAIAFFSKRPMWQKLTLVALTVPIAVIVNVGRVAVLGLLSLINEEFARGDLHIMVGLAVMLPSAALLLLGVGYVLDQIFIKPDPPPDQPVPDPDRPIQVHPTWDAPTSPWQSDTGFAWRMLQGVVGGAAMMLLAGVTAIMALVYARPSIMGLLMPAIGDGFAAWMAVVLGLTAALGGVVVLVVVRRIAVGQWTTRLAGAQRSFATAVAAGVLLSAAMGFSSVIAAAQIVHFKAPVPLRDQLYLLPQSMRGWEMVGRDETLPPEIVEQLGTNIYLSRMYRLEEPQESGAQIPAGTSVRLHVAYYTGTPDTVPHVPDRCFAAVGATGSINRGLDVSLSGPQYFEREDGWWAISRFHPYEVRVPSMTLSVTNFHYSRALDPTAAALGTTDVEVSRGNVIYFFVANGRFLASPNEVRMQGFDPRDSHAYYCKVEVAVNVADAEEALRIANVFLSAMMPELLRCLPDWVEVTEGRWPPPRN